MPKTIHVFFAAGLFGNLNSAQVINLLLTLMKYLCTMPFFWWNQYPSARQGQFCHWGKELWVLWGLEGIFGVCFSVLSVVTAQVPCPLCGALKVGNAQNSRGWGWRCRSSTGLRAGADELPCHTDVTHAMKSCRGFALSQVSQRAEDAWQVVVSWGVEGCLLPAACQSTGGSLGVNARQAFCVFSKISAVFPGDHSFYEEVELHFLPLWWGTQCNLSLWPQMMKVFLYIQDFFRFGSWL